MYGEQCDVGLKNKEINKEHNNLACQRVGGLLKLLITAVPKHVWSLVGLLFLAEKTFPALNTDYTKTMDPAQSV